MVFSLTAVSQYILKSHTVINLTLMKRALLILIIINIFKVKLIQLLAIFFLVLYFKLTQKI
jgi:hypothetical protein